MAMLNPALSEFPRFGVKSEDDNLKFVGKIKAVSIKSLVILISVH